jgi:hypothetical protein
MGRQWKVRPNQLWMAVLKESQGQLLQQAKVVILQRHSYLMYRYQAS